MTFEKESFLETDATLIYLKAGCRGNYEFLPFFNNMYIVSICVGVVAVLRNQEKNLKCIMHVINGMENNKQRYWLQFIIGTCVGLTAVLREKKKKNGAYF